MKRIIIDNIPDAMFEHIVNGFTNSSDAATTLSLEQQQTVVGARIFDYCAQIARDNAVEFARAAAAAQVGAMADQMIAQTQTVLSVTIEEKDEQN